jgi:uncharacterized delta-60 repeat protein
MTRRLVRAPLVVALAAVLAGGLVVATPAASVAKAGDLDPSFGTAGVATAPPSGTLPGTGASSLAIDSSGRIVTAGSAHDDMANQDVFTVHRFLPSGAIDDSFGDHGVAIVPMTTGYAINTVTGVGVQPDGHIVVGARVYPPDAVGLYAVMRLTAAGELDADFDGGVAANGILLLNVGPIVPPAGSEVARALTVDEAGRILMSGVTYYAGPPIATMHATMARLNPDGTGDTSFSGDGNFDLLLPTIASDFKAFADLAGAGGYALGGYTNPNAGPTVGQPSIIRVSETGDLVAGFTSPLSNTPGMSTTYWQDDHTKLGEITALVELADGGLVAGGYQNQGTGTAALAKYTTTGALDPSFGTAGVKLFQVGGDSSAINDLVAQPDGKVLAAMYGGPSQHGYVVRFTATGELDPTFGQGGVVETDPLAGTYALERQGDGKIVAVVNRGNPDTTLVRLLADPPPVAVSPSIQVTSPAGKKVKAKKFKAFAGTAGPAASVSLVQLAVQKVDKKLLKSDHRCLWLANHKGKFKKVKAKHKKCSVPVYRPATGTASWSYALRQQLPKAKYVLYAQVRLADGSTATVTTRFRVT